MAQLRLSLQGLRFRNPGGGDEPAYTMAQVTRRALDWDSVVKGTHSTNCWYQKACVFNIYVKDGVVVREEQVGGYPPRNNADVPDWGPRGCQKGVCYASRMYDPARLKYPLKRVGPRGSGQWQRVTWDEALTEIADTILDVLATDGPDAIGLTPGTMGTALGAGEGTGLTPLITALGSPHQAGSSDDGDEHEGAAVTFGKVMICGTADQWFYADMLFIWGGNPAYTNMPNFHYITEARYHGTRVVVISPDYNPSTPVADLWLPVNIGSDSALALSIAQVILREKLHKEDFIREQTDMPLLVREDNRRFLREKDLRAGGRDDVLYLWDTKTNRVAEAPRKSLALGQVVPALEGSFRVNTISGPVTVRPVFSLLKAKLDADYTPEQAAKLTGVSAKLIEQLARDVATSKGIINVSTSGFGKFYHGDLIERAMILVFALCGHLGRKEATYNAFPGMSPDTAVGTLETPSQRILVSAAANDPRYAQWREDGFTDEMIMWQYEKDLFDRGIITGSVNYHYFHSGLLELSKKHNSWDPYLKRPLQDYVDEALAKGWQVIVPPPGKDPRILFSAGGNVLRRARGSGVIIENLLPKLRLLVTIDWRVSSTGLYSDFLLPCCGWYERTSVIAPAYFPYLHISNKATEPLYDSKSEWELVCLLARRVQDRARDRGMHSYQDKDGKEWRLDSISDRATFNQLYAEDELESLHRDAVLNAHNLEKVDWEETKEKGYIAFTGVGLSLRSAGNAGDLEAGEPFVPLTWHTQKKDPYPTLTRRIQFYIDHDFFLELGEEFPTFKVDPKAGGDYPLRVTGGHARWSIHSCWADHDLVLRLQRGRPLMFLSTRDAQARGIADGDEVEVHNDISSVKMLAAVSPAVRPGQAIIYHSWENFQFPGKRHFKSLYATPLNPRELAGGYFHIRPTYKACMPGFSDRDSRVEVRRVGG